MLYSSTNRYFNVWSLDTYEMISEQAAHQSVIKAMVVWPEKNVLVTACDKTISLWDLVSLQVRELELIF